MSKTLHEAKDTSEACFEIPGKLGRTCILVLGMHRSGTSAMTRVLSCLGAKLPINLLGANSYNEAGHWEPARLVELHDWLLAEGGSRWNQWRAFDSDNLPQDRQQYYREKVAQILKSEFDDAPLVVVKDPRICLFAPLFAEAVRAAGYDLRVVFVVRNPSEVCASLEARDGLDADHATLLWLRHVLDAELASRNTARAIVTYENLLADWRTNIEYIGETLSIDWPIPVQDAEAAIEDFLTPSLRHHVHTLENLHENKGLRGWVAGAFGALTEMSQSTDVSSQTARLDAIRAVFEGSSFAPDHVYRHQQEASERRERELQEIISEKTSESETLKLKMSEHDARIAELEAETERLRAQLNEREGELALERDAAVHNTAELGRLAARLADREAEVLALRSSTSWRTTAPLRQLRTLADVARRSPAVDRVSEWRSRRVIRDSGLFDADWYLAGNPDVRLAGMEPVSHYVRFGWAEGRWPSPVFDSTGYLDQNPDVRNAGMNPLLHYIVHGRAEGRPLSVTPSEDDNPPSLDSQAFVMKQSTDDDGRPRVLVLPAIFAMGGAERNTAAVMQELSNQFRFVVVTNEQHTEQGGCLFDAIASDSEAIFDMASIASRDDHMELLKKICDRFPPDLVWVCNGSVWYHQNLGEILSLFRGIPIVDQQVYDSQNGWVNSLTKDYVSETARLIAINAKIRDRFIAELCSEDKVDLIYHAVDIGRLPKAKAADEYDENRTARFYFVGRLADQKRPLDLIDVARIVGETDLPIEFIMVGNGPLSGACERRIEQLGLSNISIRPFVDDVAGIYEAADAIIFVSEYEGLPIVMLEALASGVPVLATDVGDIRLVADQLGGGCEVIHDAIGRPDIIADALVDFHRNLAHHKQAAALISETVRGRFGSENVARQYLDSWMAAWQAFAEQDLRQ